METLEFKCRRQQLSSQTICGLKGERSTNLHRNDDNSKISVLAFLTYLLVKSIMLVQCKHDMPGESKYFKRAFQDFCTVCPCLYSVLQLAGASNLCKL